MDDNTATSQPSPALKNTANNPAVSSKTDNQLLVTEPGEINVYTLFESLSDAIFLLDGDRIIDCNQKTLDMFVCSRDLIINQSLRRFMPRCQPDGSDSGERLEQKINKALQGEPQFFECKLVQLNNNLFDAEINFNSVELKDKRRLHCIVRDVTVHKREEELYRTLTTSSPVGIYIVRDGRFRFVNPRFQEFVGYSLKELIGRESISLIYSDDREQARKSAIRMLKGERTAPYEFRTVTKSGQIKWTMETVIPISYDGKREALGNYMDIDDHKKAEEALKASEERYRTILENIEDGYYELDLKGNFTFFNESCCKIFGYSREEMTPMSENQCVDKNICDKIFGIALNVYQSGRPEKGSDLEIIRKDGFRRHIEISVSLIKDTTGNTTGYRGIIRDIDERKKAEATILHMAYHDALTGLPNRVLFNDRLNVAMSTAKRNNKKFVLMILDLDKFKSVNDSLGHDAGDQLLQNVGNRLRARLRKSDTVARLGGDEFIILLPEVDHEEYAEVVAGKIIASFQRVFTLGQNDLNITASIGIAVYPDNGFDFDTLKKNADIAMYKAKECGRNNFQTMRI
jgi:diguanylate cyclase (GGDEF)-like protein/PAS domain S-box-containing protein